MHLSGRKTVQRLPKKTDSYKSEASENQSYQHLLAVSSFWIGTWCHTCSLHNSGKMNLCMPPGLWYFVMAVLGKSHTMWRLHGWHNLVTGQRTPSWPSLEHSDSLTSWTLGSKVEVLCHSPPWGDSASSLPLNRTSVSLTLESVLSFPLSPLLFPLLLICLWPSGNAFLGNYMWNYTIINSEIFNGSPLW